jgi:hypothetical protein
MSGRIPLCRATVYILNLTLSWRNRKNFFSRPEGRTTPLDTAVLG